MSNIWHFPPEQPDPFKSWDVLVVYEANDRKEMMYSTQFVHATDGMYVNRWCYLDDLLALEAELKHAKEQVEVYHEFITKLYLNGNITGEHLERLIEALDDKEHFADTSKKIDQKDEQ